MKKLSLNFLLLSLLSILACSSSNNEGSEQLYNNLINKTFIVDALSMISFGCSGGQAPNAEDEQPDTSETPPPDSTITFSENSLSYFEGISQKSYLGDYNIINENTLFVSIPVEDQNLSGYVTVNIDDNRLNVSGSDMNEECESNNNDDDDDDDNKSGCTNDSQCGFNHRCSNGRCIFDFQNYDDWPDDNNWQDYNDWQD